MKIPTVEELFKAGGHLGHRKDKTDASMKEYVFRVQNKISVINLDKSAEKLIEAIEYVKDLSSKGKVILFVGTKREISQIIKEAAVKAKMPYVTERWIGGLITNFKSVKAKIDELKKMEEGREKKAYTGLTKKERKTIDNKIEKANIVFGGIKQMNNLPDAVIIFDTHKEAIAMREAAKAKIEIIGLNDMKYEKKIVKKFVPINDESRKAVKIMADAFVAAIKEGKKE